MVKVIIRPLNVEFIANSVAEELVDCVKAGELEDTQAIWYLELIRSMYESNENSEAFYILNAVLHYAESPAASVIEGLLEQIDEKSMAERFFEAFFDNHEIDDYLLELTIHRTGYPDRETLLS